MTLARNIVISWLTQRFSAKPVMIRFRRLYPKRPSISSIGAT
jgi:hypothetical protein